MTTFFFRIKKLLEEEADEVIGKRSVFQLSKEEFTKEQKKSIENKINRQKKYQIRMAKKLSDINLNLIQSNKKLDQINYQPKKKSRIRKR